MNALIRKEVRLILPAWLSAVGLCVLPLMIAVFNRLDNPAQTYVEHVHFALYAIPISSALLGLSAFGREFSAGTFTLLLAQPRPRLEFWNAKLFVLAVAVLSVLMTVALTSFPFMPWHAGMNLLWMWTLAALVAATGALWMTLLLRQMLAAFWLSLIVPLAITLLISFAFGEVTVRAVVVSTLVAYSVGSFLLGRKLFLTAQDAAWTGGTVTLPTLRNWLSRGRVTGLRKSHPLVALFRKEFQSQQMSQLLAVLLFVANICVLFMQKVVTVSRESILNILFDGFSFLWLIMPLMIGCSSVAEERRLGTLEPQLCLPVSRARQFLVKLAAVVLFAVLLGAIPIFLTHFIAIGFGLKGNGILSPPDARSFFVVATVSVIISQIAFYASTLCKQFLQALAATIGCGVAWFFLGNWLLKPATVGGFPLWEGPIGTIVAGGVGLCLAFGLLSWRGRWRLFLGLLCFWILQVLVESFFIGGRRMLTALPRAGISSGLAGYFLIAGPFLLLLVLAFRNFRHVHSGPGLWLKNFAVWFAAFLLTTALAAAAYHRVWEFTKPFEPPPGPARLSGNVRPMIAKYFRSGWLLALLPDGRLWAMREYEALPIPGESIIAEYEHWQAKPIPNPRAEFVGSNWVCMALSQYDGAGVQSDGSLWRVSWWERDGENGESVLVGAGNWYRNGHTLCQTPVATTRIGDDSDWVMTAAGNGHFLALKTDGTIWGWGSNNEGQLSAALPKTVSKPAKLGSDSDWEFIAAFSSGSVAVKRDHSVWKWGQAYQITTRGIAKSYMGGTLQKIATLPDKVTRIVSGYIADVFICNDGSGWGLGQIENNYLGSGNQFPMVTGLHKLWDDGKWIDVESEGPIFITAIQSDGSLWRQGDSRMTVLQKRAAPEPIGSRNDWIAVRTYGDTVFALAKDGMLCRFGDEAFSNEPKLTAPPRRVTWSVNVLDAAK